MTTELANALCGYFETLYDLNRHLITLCGVDVIDNYGQYEKYIADIIQEIPRLVPYSFNKKKDIYVIVKRDGLLEFSSDLPFLSADYENLLEKNYDFLSKAKTIRNKFEHKIHGARLMAAGSGSGILFDMTYKLRNGEITLSAGEIIMFTKQINELFSKIQKEVEQFVYERGEAAHPYFRRLIRYNFCDFNKIYDSPVLKLVGKALFPF